MVSAILGRSGLSICRDLGVVGSRSADTGPRRTNLDHGPNKTYYKNVLRMQNRPVGLV